MGDKLLKLLKKGSAQDMNQRVVQLRHLISQAFYSLHKVETGLVLHPGQTGNKRLCASRRSAAQQEFELVKMVINIIYHRQHMITGDSGQLLHLLFRGQNGEFPVDIGIHIHQRLRHLPCKRLEYGFFT